MLRCYGELSCGSYWRRRSLNTHMWCSDNRERNAPFVLEISLAIDKERLGIESVGRMRIDVQSKIGRDHS